MTITEMFLTPNKYSRPQIKLEKVTKIAVHYVGNPRSTAKNNRDYFKCDFRFFAFILFGCFFVFLAKLQVFFFFHFSL